MNSTRVLQDLLARNADKSDTAYKSLDYLTVLAVADGIRAIDLLEHANEK